MKINFRLIFQILITIVSVFLAAGALFMGMFLAAMGSDAPGSADSPMYYVMAFAITFIPPALIVASCLVSWIYYSRKNYMLAAAIGLLPLLLVGVLYFFA